MGAGWLREAGVDEAIINGVLAHAHEQYRTDLVSRAIVPADAVTGFLVACALVHRGLPAGMALPFLALGALPLRRAARSALIAVPAFAVALAAGAALERVPFLREVARTATSVLARANRPVLEQLEHLKTYPGVQERLSRGNLRLHGWWFDIKEADVYEYEQSEGRFHLIDETYAVKLLNRDIDRP